MTVLAITGARGVVGSVLTPQLEAMGHDVIPLGLPDCDVLNANQLWHGLMRAEAVLHLAGVWEVEHYMSPERDERNALMLSGVLRTALSIGASQFIHASSVHVEDSFGLVANPPLEPVQACAQQFLTEPTSGYGWAKRDQEVLVRTFAPQFVGGAVSVRFGCVRPDNQPPPDENPAVAKHERAIWLENSDAAALIDCIVRGPRLAQFSVLYATSTNAGSPYDLTNPFGWAPQHGLAE